MSQREEEEEEKMENLFIYELWGCVCVYRYRSSSLWISLLSSSPPPHTYGCRFADVFIFSCVLVLLLLFSSVNSF